MIKFKIFEALAFYGKPEDNHKINLSPTSNARHEIMKTLKGMLKTLCILDENTENLGLNDDLYLRDNYDKKTMTLLRTDIINDLIHIECGVGSFGKYSHARGVSGEDDKLSDKSAESDRYVSIILPNSDSNQLFFIFEADGNVDARKRLLDYFETYSPEFTSNGKKINFILKQVVDTEYIKSFIEDSKNLKVEFRGNSPQTDGTLDPKFINLQLSVNFDQETKQSFWEKISRWRDEESDPLQDMAFFSFGSDIFSSTEVLNDIDEVRFLINQKVFTVEELLGQSFSYDISTKHPSINHWYDVIIPKMNQFIDELRDPFSIPEISHLTNNLTDAQNDKKS
ncbi:hypothetical protein [Rothia nasimurium]|uniref:hypothetical protein n=1 Tax=Rothia nasimurium TaxID=85336 RepID=UPI003BA24CBA